VFIKQLCGKTCRVPKAQATTSSNQSSIDLTDDQGLPLTYR
jgi:hypothetical protein